MSYISIYIYPLPTPSQVGAILGADTTERPGGSFYSSHPGAHLASTITLHSRAWGEKTHNEGKRV